MIIEVASSFPSIFMLNGSWTVRERGEKLSWDGKWLR